MQFAEGLHFSSFYSTSSKTIILLPNQALFLRIYIFAWEKAILFSCVDNIYDIVKGVYLHKNAENTFADIWLVFTYTVTNGYNYTNLYIIADAGCSCRHTEREQQALHPEYLHWWKQEDDKWGSDILTAVVASLPVATCLTMIMAYLKLIHTRVWLYACTLAAMDIEPWQVIHNMQ